MPFPISTNTLILDASCVISLYASRQMFHILDAIPRTVTVATYVAEKEVLNVYGDPGENGQPVRQPVDLRPFIDAGLLQLVSIDSEEEAETFATFASMIRDQGEAITGAIAYHRNWAVVMDDRKARRLLSEHAGHLPLLYTLDLVKYWADVQSPAPSLLSTALQNIRHYALYTPPRRHLLFDWWHENDGG